MASSHLHAPTLWVYRETWQCDCMKEEQKFCTTFQNKYKVPFSFQKGKLNPKVISNYPLRIRF